MSSIDDELWELKRRAGNATTYRIDEQIDDDDDDPDTLEDYLYRSFRAGVEVDESRGLIGIKVSAENVVDPGDMRKLESHLNQLLKQFYIHGGAEQQLPPAQFVGVKADDQFTVVLVFHLTENPTKFGG